MGVLAEFVTAIKSSAPAHAPHGILGRGVQRPDEQWGSIVGARASAGAPVCVSRRPGNRMGLRAPARQHARHQLERNVHRIAGPSVGRSRFYGAFVARSSGEAGLLREAHRTGARHGRFLQGIRSKSKTAFSGSSRFTLQDRFVAPSYTRLAAGRRFLRPPVLFCFLSLMRRKI